MRATLVGLALATLVSSTTVAQDRPSSSDGLRLDQFHPRSMLKVPQHHVPQAKFPAVDAHTHFDRRLRRTQQSLEDFVRIMDRNGIAVCVSLDGVLPNGFAEQKKLLWDQHKDRFVIFVNIDWQGDGQQNKPATWDCHREDFVRRVVHHLEVAAASGASGLKIFKQFGLGLKYPDGSLMRIDDVRWDPIWAACARLRLPVLIHVADPAAFFLPIDDKNERWEELLRHPDWSFHGEEYPSRRELLAARNRVVARHPRTIFIGAHVGNNGEDLDAVSTWLEQYPNLYVEIASRIGELGRQPYTARRFFMRYPDRILFGTDGPWPEARLRLYWRFLETYDEYFPYSEKEIPPQGFWRIYGLGLPDEVLRQVYQGNAMRIIPGVRQRIERLAGQTKH